jgi:hypothetical protein
MEEVVVEVGVREHLVNDSQLRTTVSAIRSASGFDGDGAKPHSFFFLRSMRVVTRTSANLSMGSFNN